MVFGHWAGLPASPEESANGSVSFVESLLGLGRNLLDLLLCGAGSFLDLSTSVLDCLADLRNDFLLYVLLDLGCMAIDRVSSSVRPVHEVRQGSLGLSLNLLSRVLVEVLPRFWC